MSVSFFSVWKGVVEAAKRAFPAAGPQEPVAGRAFARPCRTELAQWLRTGCVAANMATAQRAHHKESHMATLMNSKHGLPHRISTTLNGMS